MGLFKIEVANEDKPFIQAIVERICKSIDGLTKAIRDKKLKLD